RALCLPTGSLLFFLAFLAPASLVLAQTTSDSGDGKALFEKVWQPSDGLGPLYAENSCATCHSGPGDGATIAFVGSGIVTRGLTIHLGDAQGRPDPVYGGDFQSRALPGLASEGTVSVTAP